MGGYERSGGQRDLFRIGLESVEHGHLRGRLRVECLLKDRALGHGEPDPHADGDEQRAGQERDPPSPLEELLVGQRCRQQGVGTRSEDEAGRHADLGPGTVEAAPVLGSVLDGHQRRTTPLAADAEALSEAQHDEQNRCPDADRGVAGQQAHQHRRRAHEQQRVDQHWLAADLVAVMGEDGAAEGPAR